MRKADRDDTDDELRAELAQACETVSLQIDRLTRSMRSVRGGGGDRLAMRRLKETLADLQAALARLSP